MKIKNRFGSVLLRKPFDDNKCWTTSTDIHFRKRKFSKFQIKVFPSNEHIWNKYMSLWSNDGGKQIAQLFYFDKKTDTLRFSIKLNRTFGGLNRFEKNEENVNAKNTQKFQTKRIKCMAIQFGIDSFFKKNLFLMK